MNGFVCLFRKFLQWGWHDCPNVVTLWIHLLCLANYEDKVWHGMTIGRGQLITSVRNLATLVGLSDMQVRLALNKLQSTNEIVIKTTNKNTIITICKYDYYQSLEKEWQQTNNKQITNKQQQHNNNNNNNNKEDKSSMSVAPTLNIDYGSLLTYFNEQVKDTEIKQIVKMTEIRKSAIHRRAMEHGKDAVAKVIMNAAKSNFLNGDNNHHFIATFDWLMKPNNFLKVLEGNYANK